MLTYITSILNHQVWSHRKAGPAYPLRLGSARTIYTVYVQYFWQGRINKHSVIYGAYIRSWPTLTKEHYTHTQNHTHTQTNIHTHTTTRTFEKMKLSSVCISWRTPPIKWNTSVTCMNRHTKKHRWCIINTRLCTFETGNKRHNPPFKWNTSVTCMNRHTKKHRWCIITKGCAHLRQAIRGTTRLLRGAPRWPVQAGTHKIRWCITNTMLRTFVT